MGRKFATILETVGNTPVVRIGKLAPPDVNLFVKSEAFNPLGSVKDRLALGVIEDAEKRGVLKPGDTFRVPDKPNVKIRTGNAGGLVVMAEGGESPPLGSVGQVLRDVGQLHAPARIRQARLLRWPREPGDASGWIRGTGGGIRQRASGRAGQATRAASGGNPRVNGSAPRPRRQLPDSFETG